MTRDLHLLGQLAPEVRSAAHLVDGALAYAQRDDARPSVTAYMVEAARTKLDALAHASRTVHALNDLISAFKARDAAREHTLLALYDMDHQDFGQHRILDVGYDARSLVLRKFPDTEPGAWQADPAEPPMWFSPCGRYGVAPAYVVPTLPAPEAPA